MKRLMSMPKLWANEEGTKEVEKASAVNDKVEAKKIKALYKKLFGKPWPKGWEVMLNVYGICDFNTKTIWLNQPTLEADKDIAIHELLHLFSGKTLKHGKKFDKMLAELKKNA